jgi:hypothetical protein
MVCTRAVTSPPLGSPSVTARENPFSKITPGSAMAAAMNVTPASTRSGPSNSARTLGESTPFCSVRTAV